MSGRLRVVVFGPARAGKSALAAVLAHHLVGRGVSLLDADGRQADGLLAGDAPGPLTAEVRAADALVLVVDAAAPSEEIDATFAAFADFLRRLEEGRVEGRVVGGLPVVLTLAKCDALHQAGDEPSDWLHRVEGRKAEVRQRFEDRFGDELAVPADGYLPFGSLDLLLGATAREVPAGPGFAAYADPGGSFGVRDLVATLLPAAAGHQEREDSSARRLRRTAGGTAGLVLALLAGLGVLASGPAGDPLAERVRAFQRREGPPAVRLADRPLAVARKELLAIRGDRGFERLPDGLRGFVAARLREAEAYTDFRKGFDPPRLGPAEVRSRQQMDALAADLAGPLAVPPEYSGEWGDSDAGRLAAKWQADLGLLQGCESLLHDWYRDHGRRGDLLLLTESPPDPAWRAAVEKLLAEEPPHAPADPVAGSPAAPGPRGKPLTWAAAFAVDRAASAARDWADTAGRLTALRELTDAVGLTAAGPLVFPDPVPKGLAARLLPALPADGRWRTDRFPDPVRGVVSPRLRAAHAAGVRAVRGLVPTSPAALVADPELRAWGELLRRLAGWADPGTPATDPVQELASFLRRDRFDLDLSQVRVTLPDDLTDPPPTPAGPLTVTHTPAGGPPVVVRLTPGDPTRNRPTSSYPFAGGGVLVVRPGDTLTATLPVRSGGEVRELVWPAGSGPFAYLRLLRPPRLGDAEAAGVALAAPGLTAPVLLPDPGGR